ncbi:MAG: hypothetical protein ACOYL5_00240 [Phototrophicaceae bacterium]|jgi:hypothetical protein
MITLVLHISNSEPIKVDVDEMPKASDTAIIGKNPRERSDKELIWIDDGVTTVIFPWWRINYIQVLPEAGAQQEFPNLFRE